MRALRCSPPAPRLFVFHPRSEPVYRSRFSAESPRETGTSRIERGRIRRTDLNKSQHRPRTGLAHRHQAAPAGTDQGWHPGPGPGGQYVNFRRGSAMYVNGTHLRIRRTRVRLTWDRVAFTGSACRGFVLDGSRSGRVGRHGLVFQDYPDRHHATDRTRRHHNPRASPVHEC